LRRRSVARPTSYPPLTPTRTAQAEIDTRPQASDASAQPRTEDQGRYLDALASHSPLVTIVDGRFQGKQRQCWQCGSEWLVHEERETDVNIAVALVEDTVLDRYDTALLISADSDLRPAIGAIRRLRPEKLSKRARRRAS
jgi:uncharacterized LabA/DUF88 family protein